MHNWMSASAPEQPEFKRYLRMLAVVAAPVVGRTEADLPPAPLDLWGEWRLLEEAIYSAWDVIRRRGAPWAVVRLNPPTRDTLSDALAAGEGDSAYQVIHFSGHAAETALVLEDELGRTDWVNTGELIDLLRDSPVKLVVLNACKTGEMARRLHVEAGIPAVIGMADRLRDDEGKVLTRRLYAWLARGQPVSAAFAEAVTVLRREYERGDLPVPDSWAGSPQAYIDERLSIPILYGDTQLELPAGDARAASSLITLSEPPARGMEMRLVEGFVGRGRELVQAARWLQDRPSPVIAVSGLGGLGKSALAAMAVLRQSWRFQAVIVLSARDNPQPGPDDLVPLLDGVLGLGGTLSAAPNQAERLHRAIEELNQNQVLLILDNLDQLAEPAVKAWSSFLAGLDPRRGSVAFLTLRPAVLPPLTNLSSRAHLALERLGQPDSLRLLAGGITQRKLWDKVPPAGHLLMAQKQRLEQLSFQAYLNWLPLPYLATIEQLADRAGRHPLALRLALGDLAYAHVDWAKVLANMSDLQGKDWEEQAEAMVGNMVADLQQAAPEVVRLLQAALIFPGSVGYEALRAVAGEPDDPAVFDDRLKTALDASLLETLGSARYALHPLTQAYLSGHRPLSEADERLFASRQAGYFLDFVELHENDFDLLESELPNLRAAFAYLTSAPEGYELDTIDFAVFIFAFLDVRGYWADALEWLAAGMQAAENQGETQALAYLYTYAGKIHQRRSEWAQAMEVYNRAAPLLEAAGDTQMLATVYNNIGQVYSSQSEWEPATEYFNRAIPLLEAAGDRDTLPRVYNNMGVIYTNHSQWDQALEYYNRALPLLEESGDRHMVATLHNNIGGIYLYRSEWEQALNYFNQAAPVLEETGDRRMLATVYNNIGQVLYSLSEWDKAMDYYNQAAPVLEAIGDWQMLATIYLNLGQIHYSRREYDPAMDYYHRALPLLEAAGDRRGQGVAHASIGSILYERGEFDQALDFLNQAVQILEAIGDQQALAALYNNIGQLHANRDEWQPAMDYFNRAVPVLEAIGDRRMLGTVNNNIGLIHYNKSEFDLALEYYERAIRGLKAAGDRNTLARTYFNTGLAHYYRSEYEPALEYLSQAASLEKSLGDQAEMERAEEWIKKIREALEVQRNLAAQLEEIQKSFSEAEDQGE